MANPFKPTAGVAPPLLVGRDEFLEEFEESIDNGPGAPTRLSVITGARGIGKTVLLHELADRVRRRSWITITDIATPGLMDRLLQEITRHLEELDPTATPGRSLTGFSLPGGLGMTVSERPAIVVDWRRQVDRLLDVLERHGTGLMITIDEVHQAGRDELRQLATSYQLLITRDRNVAMSLAGLPSAISDLLNTDVLTFLRRADRMDLRDVALDDVRDAFRTTIEDGGRSITPDALEQATKATGGYPFMIQLVGYQIWRKATGDVIDEKAVAEGIPVARRKLGSLVHATALADLSDVDRTYLLAMAQDDGESSTGTIAERLDASLSYASKYRSRLIEAGVIEPTRHGRVDFAIPYLREYLREHAAQYEIADRTR